MKRINLIIYLVLVMSCSYSQTGLANFGGCCNGTAYAGEASKIYTVNSESYDSFVVPPSNTTYAIELLNTTCANNCADIICTSSKLNYPWVCDSNSYNVHGPYYQCGFNNGIEVGMYYCSNCNITMRVWNTNSHGFTNTVKTGCVNENINFTAADFKNNVYCPSYQAGKENIKILSLPPHGTLSMAGANVSVDQKIIKNNITNLAFIPETGWMGSSSFNWTIGNEDTPYSTNIDLLISPTAPVVKDIAKTGYMDTTTEFTAADFSNNFVSSCSNNRALAEIKIVTLPNFGVLKLSGNNVTANQTISTNDLANLTYVPNVGYIGTDSFSWGGGDGTLASTNQANVNLTILSTTFSSSSSSFSNAAPVISSINASSGAGAANGVIGSVATFIINGANFADNPTVKLVNGKNFYEVVVNNATNEQINCTLNLANITAAMVGSWDVVVINPDGKSATLTGGFLIASGTTPIISNITTDITNNILTITIGGTNFVAGTSGVEILLINGDGVAIEATVVEVTDIQVICVVDISINPVILTGDWEVQVTNADNRPSERKSARFKGMESQSSSINPNSWVVPTAVAVSAAAVVGAVTATSCFILHKKQVWPFKPSNNGGDVALSIGGAAPIYDPD